MKNSQRLLASQNAFRFHAFRRLLQRLAVCCAGGMICCAVPMLSRAAEIQLDPQATNPDIFKGSQTTGVIRNVANYKVGAVAWQTTTNPLSFESASQISAQGMENPFMQALSNNLGAGWSYDFNTGAIIADNTFQVRTYEALAPTPPASNNDAFVADGNEQACVTNNDCVGSEFYVHYNPTGADPTANVHWIQVLYDNYANGKQVAPFYEIDNNDRTAPYYDGPYFANASGFLDLPYTHRPGEQTIFDAMLLLVTGPDADAPGKVTIYGAVTWGWSNQPVPVPAAVWLLGSGLAFLVGIGYRKGVPIGQRE